MMNSDKKTVGRPPKHMGKLGRWIKRNGRSREDVASDLGITRGYLDRLCSEERSPSGRVALKIEKLTVGEVSVEYLMRPPADRTKPTE